MFSVIVDFFLCLTIALALILFVIILLFGPKPDYEEDEL
jgi:hypothetical protein